MWNQCRCPRYWAVLATAAATLLLLQAVPAVAQSSGAVFVMTNSNSGNSIIVYSRAADGTLTQVQQVATGGLGSGGSNDPLGSEGSLTQSDDKRFLFAVNAGSNNVSVLGVDSAGVHLLSKTFSGGKMPISVTVHGDLVYVLNGGGTPHINGFVLNLDGSLTPLANSTRLLAGGANSGPAEVRFSNDGTLLVVTEKNTGFIDVFRVGDDGRAVAHLVQKSSGATPFGFSFGAGNTLVVSEAESGAAGASTVSSYEAEETGALNTISASVPDTETAACWIVITNDGQIAFASNTGSAAISSFAVAVEGGLTLISGTAAQTGKGPIDMALTRDSAFLYVLNSGGHSLSGYRVEGGALTLVETVSGLPASIQGIAAR